MSRVKRFIDNCKVVLRLLAKLSGILGSTFAAIEVVDSVVDTFVKARENGALKDASFYQFAKSICDLVADLSALGEPVLDAVAQVHDLILLAKDQLSK